MEGGTPVASDYRAEPTWSSPSANARLQTCHVGPSTPTISDYLIVQRIIDCQSCVLLRAVCGCCDTRIFVGLGPLRCKRLERLGYDARLRMLLVTASLGEKLTELVSRLVFESDDRKDPRRVLERNNRHYGFNRLSVERPSPKHGSYLDRVRRNF